MGKTPANRPANDRLLPRQRSAVTNGKRIFVNGADGNSPWVRRYKDIITEHAADLGGADTLSQAQLSLIRRAATLSVELEQMESQLSLGERVDLDLYGRLAGHQRRTIESLGIKRVVKQIDYREYLGHRK